MSASTKRKTENINKSAKKKRGENILNFWNTHYNIAKKDTQYNIDASEVFGFYQSLLAADNSNNPDTLDHFVCLSTNIGVTCKKAKANKQRYLVAAPTSSLSIAYHSKSSNLKKNNTSLHLLNIRGLITNKENKSESIEKLLSASTTSNIIILTETHLTVNHFNAEILRHLKNYNIIRSDRNITPNPDDDFQLLSGGGCAILTSPNIVTVQKVTYSNGNCELAISECPEIKTFILALYKPPLPNFNLLKFSEVLNEARNSLNKMLENQSEYKVILAGDFNFHPKVVEWIRCDEGIFPDIKPGNTDEKLALQLLLDFTNDFELEQIVDEPTRESNILDLIFTNNLEIFSDQNIQILRPITDHNIVSFKIQINSHETIAANLPNNIRDISLYNFKSGNQELFKEALADTPWHNLFTPQTIETANENFNTALVQAANKAKVPKFKQKKDINDNNNIDVPNKERNRLMEHINNPGIRSVDKAIKVTRLEVLNKQLQNQHIEDRMREENKVINNVLLPSSNLQTKTEKLQRKSDH